MKHPAIWLIFGGLIALAPAAAAQSAVPAGPPRLRTSAAGSSPAEQAAQSHVLERLQADLTTVQTFRPAYPFWQYIFSIPDGRIVIGSARDGRLLATLPQTGDWTRDGKW